MKMKFNCTIIGAGIIGLAIARQLTHQHQGDNDVLVIDKEASFGRGISSRNSEVIHSGLYYSTGSLKHRLCLRGRPLLYSYCQQRQVPFQKCGKLIVAYHDHELLALKKLYQHGLANHIEGLEILTPKEVASLEPDLKVAAALYSPETGIIDAHQLMHSLLQEIEENNGTVLFNADVVNAAHHQNSYQLRLKDHTTIYSDQVINAAGLGADQISNMLNTKSPIIYPCKGSYFSYQGKHSFKHLIYPLPDQALTGLGIHATLDLNQRLRFGPDTQYLDLLDDFSVDSQKKNTFYHAAKHLLPQLELEQLQPDMAGIRPKLQGPDDQEVKDFYIKAEPDLPGFINLLGIESPGLTSALAIAKQVEALCS